MSYKTEILSPAGSIEAAKAAVLSGADAIYMGFGDFNARKNAKNFSREEAEAVFTYCQGRGVKVYVTLNTLLTDKELHLILADIAFLCEKGIDAVIVQDLAVAVLIRECCPSLPLHASTQMTIHNLDGAMQAKALGFQRIVLSRELPLTEIAYITQHCGIETEVFVHGALCMSYSGQCFFSAMLGSRSGNRGLCAQPCRLPFCREGKKGDHALSLKDLSLADYVTQLAQVGVASLKIEGRMKRPEYVAIVTKIYAALLREQRKPSLAEIQALEQAFSRDGFTQGYATGKKGDSMFGTKTEIPFEQVKNLYSTYMPRGELEKIGIDMTFIVKNTLILEIEDEDGNRVSVEAGAPEPAANKATTTEQLEKQLVKLGGTFYYKKRLVIEMDDPVFIAASAVNALRREGLKKLTSLREIRQPHAFTQPLSPEKQKNKAFAGYTVEVTRMGQILPEMLGKVTCFYVPLLVLQAEKARFKDLLARGETVVAVLPRVYMDTEREEIVSALNELKEVGLTRILCQNIGHISLGRELNLALLGDYGLNIFNSRSLGEMRDAGLLCQTLSFELKLAQIRDLQKCMETELIVYGHLPLMIFENCRIKTDKGCQCQKGEAYLTDRKGVKFPLLPAFGCRNTLLNSQALYLPKRADYLGIGITYGRLCFTTESSDLCKTIFLAHLEGKTLPLEGESTRGLYYRGVE